MIMGRQSAVSVSGGGVQVVLVPHETAAIAKARLARCRTRVRWPILAPLNLIFIRKL